MDTERTNTTVEERRGIIDRCMEYMHVHDIALFKLNAAIHRDSKQRIADNATMELDNGEDHIV